MLWSILREIVSSGEELLLKLKYWKLSQPVKFLEDEPEVVMMMVRG